MVQDWRSAHVEYVLATRYDERTGGAWYKLATIYLFGLNAVKIDEPLALDMTLLAIKLGAHPASSLYANYGLAFLYTTKNANHEIGVITHTRDPGKRMFAQARTHTRAWLILSCRICQRTLCVNERTCILAAGGI